MDEPVLAAEALEELGPADLTPDVSLPTLLGRLDVAGVFDSVGALNVGGIVSGHGFSHQRSRLGRPIARAFPIAPRSRFVSTYCYGSHPLSTAGSHRSNRS